MKIYEYGLNVDYISLDKNNVRQSMYLPISQNIKTINIYHHSKLIATFSSESESLNVGLNLYPESSMVGSFKRISGSKRIPSRKVWEVKIHLNSLNSYIINRESPNSNKKNLDLRLVFLKEILSIKNNLSKIKYPIVWDKLDKLYNKLRLK